MRIAILPTPEDIAVVAADRIQSLLERKPSAVLGLATGSTPLPLYDELTKRYEAGEISFADTQSFNLDEYVGLPEDHPEGYANFIHRFLVDRVDFPKGAAHGPNVWTGDNDQAAADYDKAIRDAGGIDLQILGIGADGHIGFNEPGGSFASRTHVDVLTEQTRRDNARFFDGDITKVPTHLQPARERPRPCVSWLRVRFPPVGPPPFCRCIPMPLSCWMSLQLRAWNSRISTARCGLSIKRNSRVRGRF